MVCQPEFFVSPLRTEILHEKPLRLPYRIFFILSDFLIIVFLGAFFMTPICKFSNHSYVARFKEYDILTRDIKQLTWGLVARFKPYDILTGDIKRLTWGLIALQVCCPGILGLFNIFGCCLVNYCGGLRKGEPIQSWVHLGKSKLALFSSKSICNLCVAFGVQGTYLAVYSCVQFALTADWEALGQF